MVRSLEKILVINIPYYQMRMTDFHDNDNLYASFPVTLRYLCLPSGELPSEGI